MLKHSDYVKYQSIKSADVRAGKEYRAFKEGEALGEGGGSIGVIIVFLFLIKYFLVGAFLVFSAYITYKFIKSTIEERRMKKEKLTEKEESAPDLGIRVQERKG